MIEHAPPPSPPPPKEFQLSGVCRPHPVYTITVDQFLNLPFPEWYYAEMQDDAPASAWDRYTGKMSHPCIFWHTQWGPRNGQGGRGA